MGRALQRKAYYNYLRLQVELKLVDSDTVPSWKIEDYRLLDETELFKKLHELGIDLDSSRTLELASTFETPEEMTDALTPETNPEISDEIYLIIFELWKRYLPENESLSIFGDELDWHIFAYEKKEEDALLFLQARITELQRILDEYVDEGVPPVQALHWLQSFLVFPLDDFLYNYVLDEMESGALDDAGDHLEGFIKYFPHDPWLDYLYARKTLSCDPEKGYILFEKLIHILGLGPKQIPDLNLALEMLGFLAMDGHPSLFGALIEKTFSLLETEEDFQELGAVCVEYLHELGQESSALEVEKLLEERKFDVHAPISSKDPILHELRALLHERTLSKRIQESI